MFTDLGSPKLAAKLTPKFASSCPSNPHVSQNLSASFCQASSTTSSGNPCQTQQIPNTRAGPGLTGNASNTEHRGTAEHQNIAEHRGTAEHRSTAEHRGTTEQCDNTRGEVEIPRVIGTRFDVTSTMLGHGSYGDVYLARDEYQKSYAVKCCEITNTGISNILEATIMGSFSHPCLNNALHIQASAKKLYIIQDLAESDLAKHTRRVRGNHQPSLAELRQWCFCLSQAVAVLHSRGVIHADIKASNVLLYADGAIRLSDFTLATKKWRKGEKFTKNVCTCTHRPLECLLKQEWDEALDIWSLGCTFYEIAYGVLLFPYQNLEGENKDGGF